MSDPNDPEGYPHRSAVRWLSPSQLVRTGAEVLVSSFFARFADEREAEAAVPKAAYNLEDRLRALGGDDGVFLDYVADTGDGFNATYTVACSVVGVDEVVKAPAASPRSESVHCAACQERQGAGQLLVFGGDEVYPVASITDYAERLTNVFALAASKRSDLPDERYVAAVPGNHDWYDGLVAFRRVFGESWTHYSPTTDPAGSADPDSILESPPDDLDRLDKHAGWATIQSRSYFAIKLPHHWWVWGVDIQLGATIDAAQLDYFRGAAFELNQDPEARVIIATARPSWHDPDSQNDPDEHSNRQNLAWFIDRMLTAVPDQPGSALGIARCRLLLAGDLHHYARYSSWGDVPTAASQPGTPIFAPELVTCGGGGAYMSSTHHLREDPITPFWDQANGLTCSRQPYRGVKRFPLKSESIRLLRRNIFKAPFLNGLLPAFCALLYALMLWALASSAEDDGRWLTSRLPNLLDQHSFRPDPPGLASHSPFVFALIGLCLLLVTFAKYGAPGHPTKAVVAGSVHALAHAAVVVAVAAPLGAWSRRLEDASLRSTGVDTASYTALGVAGAFAILAVLGVLGASLLSLYLFLGDHVGLHETGAASSFRHEGYKSHLRIHVTKDALHVRAIGIETVPQFGTSASTLPEGQRARAEEVDDFVVERNATSTTLGSSVPTFD